MADQTLTKRYLKPWNIGTKMPNATSSSMIRTGCTKSPFGKRYFGLITATYSTLPTRRRCWSFHRLSQQANRAISSSIRPADTFRLANRPCICYSMPSDMLLDSDIRPNRRATRATAPTSKARRNTTPHPSWSGNPTRCAGAASAKTTSRRSKPCIPSTSRNRKSISATGPWNG